MTQTEVQQAPAVVFRFDEWTVHVADNALQGPNGQIKLEPKVMDLLAYFCANAGRTVSRGELLTSVWGGEHFSDSTVARAVSLLRQSLGDEPGNAKYIRTIPRRGYQFIPQVRVIDPVSHAGQSVGSQPAAKTAMFFAAAGSMLVVLFAASWAWFDRHSSSEPLPIEEARSLAVLPFKTSQPTKTERHIIAGFQESVANELARGHVPLDIFLITDDDANAQLKTDLALRGTVVQEADRMRLELSLQNRASQKIIWSDAFVQPLSNIAQLQTQATNALFDVMGVAAPTQAGGVIATASESYLLYLKARWHWRQRNEEQLRLAETLFKEVTQEEPDFAAAHAGLALTRLTLGNYQILDAETAYSLAQDSVDRALSLDPNHAESLLAQGQLFYQRDWNFEAALDVLSKAVEAQPDLIDAMQYLAEIHAVTGAYDDAVRNINTAVALRPYDALLVGVQGVVYTHAGRYQEANQIFTDLQSLRPSFFWHYRYWSYVRLNLGDSVGAFNTRLVKFAVLLPPQEFEALKQKVGQEHDAKFWQWQIDRLQASYPEPNAMSCLLIAEAFAATNQFERARAFTECAVSFRSEVFPLAHISPWLHPLRSQPWYQELMERHGLVVFERR